MRNKLPVDLLLITLVTGGLFVFVTGSSPDSAHFQAAFGFLFVFFVPGYALVSVLFPGSSTTEKTNETVRGAPTVGERLLLAVGLSVVIVPAVGLILSYSALGLEPTVLIYTVGLVSLALVCAAVVRRLQLPPTQQFHIAISIRTAPDRIWDWLGGANTRWEVGLNLLVVVGVVFVTVGIGAAIVSPGHGEQYTEFSVQPVDQTAIDTDTEPLSEDLTLDDGSEFLLGITNREHEQKEYTVIVELHRLEGSGSNATVVEREEIQRLSTSLEQTESYEARISADPTMTGEGLRMTFLLYPDSPPEDPSTENAYRSLYIWVDVPDSIGE